MMLSLFALIIGGVASGIPDSCPVCVVPGAVGNFTSMTNGVVVHPIGGGSPMNISTSSAFAVQGTTSQDDQREYLVTLGLESNRGADSRPTPYHDKAVLYTGITAHAGTGDVWSMNPLLTQMPGSGSYNAQGIELDFNNNNAHRGDADAGAGLAPPISYGLSVTGTGTYRSTAAISVMGEKKMWNRGVVFANDAIAQSTFQDLGNPEKSVDIRGNPTYGIYQSSAQSKNLLAGKTGIAIGTRDPSAELEVEGDIHFSGLAFHKTGGGKASPVVLGSSQVRHQKTITGNAALGVQGNAEVRLSLAELAGVSLELHEVAYSLTAIGAPMPSLHVAGELRTELDSLVFEIAGGVPGKRVSWNLHLSHSNMVQVV